ncbi:IS110 family transposase [Deinococcus sp. QL22]|uniref:IS110 family transposase n=1 Tax=Deinococcus sp. QL22 TaxID=2939437 RepID=UPI002018184C|nr:IS110 family transposase [Deinococcus sp. QL22]UQN09311.1 IS110 family transposase [Deinococcus sp. QL22]UQN09500.1 IS110 family transposase [Deinococcus sp. QL22]
MFALGLDIGKDSLYAHLRLNDDLEQSLPNLPNTPTGFKGLLQWAQHHGVTPTELHVVMEATGVYWEQCANVLFSAGCTVSVVNPTSIKYFARATLKRGKTDRMDAAVIALYGAMMRPKPWSPPSTALQELKQLVRERTALCEALTQDQNRLHALERRQHESQIVVALLNTRIALLKQQILELETAIRSLIHANDALREPFELLTSVPGFGLLTAASVLAETEGFAVLETGKQRSAHAGIAPSPFQSGTSVKGRGRISKTGNAHLRRSAYLAAWSVTRNKGHLGDFYRRLRANGKPPKVALIALGHKLLRTGLAVVRSGQPLGETYVKPASHQV